LNGDAVLRSPVFPRLAKRPSKEVPDSLVAGRGVGENDVLHLGVTLKHADCAFEEGLAEGGCPTSAPMRQIGRVEEGMISGSS
jgi:hypothetical protein